jgi:hypothetical protein
VIGVKVDVGVTETAAFELTLETAELFELFGGAVHPVKQKQIMGSKNKVQLFICRNLSLLFRCFQPRAKRCLIFTLSLAFSSFGYLP